MNDLIPTWWELTLASLAVYRLWRLLAVDEILDRPRLYLLKASGWKPGQQTPAGYRTKWADFLLCPWCAGAWITLGAWVFWLFFPSLSLVVATPFALSAVVGLIRTNLDPPED